MPNQFFMSPVSIMELSLLSHAEKSVWLALCSFAEWDEEIAYGRCFPSLISISNRSSCTKSTVCKILNRLENLGLVQRSRRSGTGHSKSTEYLLLANENNLLNLLSDKRTVGPDCPRNGLKPSVKRTKAVREMDTNISLNKPCNIPAVKAQKIAPGCQSLSGIAQVNHNPATLQLLIELWNKLLVPLGFKSVIKGSPYREEAFHNIVLEDNRRQEANWWTIVIKLIASSDFLVTNAQKKAKWLDFDWILKESNLVKIIEGKYLSSGEIGQDDERGCLEVWEDDGGDE